MSLDVGAQENALKAKAKKASYSAKDPLEKLRYSCLQRGTKGISRLGKAFKIFDDNRSGDLGMDEFHKAMRDYGVDLTDQEIEELFVMFDTDGTGKVDYEEFLIRLRPPMSQVRQDVITKAFNKLDKTGDGLVTVEDLKGVYAVRNHPQYLNGDKTENQLFAEFLQCFDGKNQDGVITKEEFMDYYSGVSSSIDSGKEGDNYFVLMMTNAWKL